MKLTINDPDRAYACVQWLMENIGPQQPGTVGNIVRGEGWTARVLPQRSLLGLTIEIELNQHVDPGDAVMFFLKWS